MQMKTLIRNAFPGSCAKKIDKQNTWAQLIILSHALNKATLQKKRKEAEEKAEPEKRLKLVVIQYKFQTDPNKQKIASHHERNESVLKC